MSAVRRTLREFAQDRLDFSWRSVNDYFFYRRRRVASH